MNEYPQHAPEDRSVRSARFFTLLHRYRSLLRRRWWLLLLLALVGMGVQWIIYKQSPPAYASIGRMIVNVKIQVQTGASYSEDLSNFLGTQVELMKSSTVKANAERRVNAARPDLISAPVNLQIGVTTKTTIFNLMAICPEKDYTQAFLDAVMEEYMSLKNDMRTRSSEKTLAGITEELLRLEKELKTNEEELLQFQATNSMVFLQEQGNSAGNYLVQLNRQLAGLQSELQLLNMLNLEQNLERQQTKGVITGARTAEGEGKEVADLFRADSDYLKVKQEIQLLKAEREQLAEYLRPKHPKMVALSEDISRKERLLEIFKQQSVEQLDNRRSSLALQVQNLQREIKEWEVGSLDISTKMARYQKIRANITRVQSHYDQLLKTMQAVDVDKDISPESVTVLEKATPALLYRASLPKGLLISGLIGLALGVGILILSDRFDDRMNSYVELNDHFEEQVLGQIPRERRPRGDTELKLIQPEDTRHAFLEAYRNVRSSLLFMSANGESRPKLLLVTSSIPNDGKSMTTANLAITLAQGGSRVVLIDADLRKGVMHRRFKVDSTPGFSEVLTQRTEWRSVVRPTYIQNLSLISCGAPSQKSSELFLQQSTPAVLRDMAKDYDYVIIDSPPVMAADDVTSLAPYAEGVLFVIRSQHTSARVARAALDLLYQRNVNVLGLVFNAVNPDVGEYYYYSKYKDYYHKPSNA
jgi:capsular exopolysaccharide synthesis family protein